MSKDEKIVIFLGVVGMAAILLHHFVKLPKKVEKAEDEIPIVDQVGVSQTVSNSPPIKGPRYLTYNAPYMFLPPVGNVMPNVETNRKIDTISDTFINNFWE